MNLNNLKPKEGSIHTSKKRVGRGQGSGKVVLRQEDIKVLSQDPVILEN